MALGVSFQCYTLTWLLGYTGGTSEIGCVVTAERFTGSPCTADPPVIVLFPLAADPTCYNTSISRLPIAYIIADSVYYNTSISRRPVADHTINTSVDDSRRLSVTELWRFPFCLTALHSGHRNQSCASSSTLTAHSK